MCFILAQDSAILADYRNEAEFLFLQRASMRKLIKGKHENDAPFLKEGGTEKSVEVDSTLFE